MKRIFDIAVSSVSLIVLAPLFVLMGILIKLGSRGSVFFRQERIGREFRPFRIYKFRTMVTEAPRVGGLITAGDDPRITRIGRILRKTKIDELPQLINVLKGEMSLVGPRPEVRKYVELFRDDYQEILKIRPGITDFASLKYHDESESLSGDVENEYVTRILPDKLALAKEYVRRSSFSLDLALILGTVPKLLGCKIATSFHSGSTGRAQ